MLEMPDKILQRNRADMNKALDIISELKYNWNQYGAEPFSKELIERVRTVANRISYWADIFPTGRNSIQLEINDLVYYEVEFFENGDTVECCINEDIDYVLFLRKVQDTEITDEHIEDMLWKGCNVKKENPNV